MITIEFNTLEDMLVFAKKLVGNGQADKPESPVTINAPVQQAPVITAPVQTQAVQTTPAQNTASTQQTTAPVQTTAPSYTMDNLASAAMTLMDSGRQPELLNLLSQFGVDALPSLPQEQYGAFATALRGLGAQI